MKDFQFVIQNFLKDHQKHKKYLALLIVLSMIVSFAVPFSLIMPAVSMTNDSASFQNMYSDNNLILLGAAPSGYENALDITTADSFSMNITDENGELLYDTNNESNYGEVSNDTLGLSFALEYQFSDKKGYFNTTDKKYMYIQTGLNENLTFNFITNSENKNLNLIHDEDYDKDLEAATFQFIDGYILITLTDAYINWLNTESNNGSLKGTLSFEGRLNRADNESGDQTFNIGGQQITVKFEDKYPAVAKSAETNTSNGTITWTIVVNNSAKLDLSGYTLTDNMFAHVVGDVSITPSVGKFDNNQVTFAPESKNAEYITITYTTNITEDLLKAGKASNTATLTKGDKTISSNPSEVWLGNAFNVDKKGTPDYQTGEYQKKINWEINISSKYGTSLNGYKITDENIPDNYTIEPSTVKMTKNGNVWTINAPDSVKSFKIKYATDTNPDANTTYNNNVRLDYPTPDPDNPAGGKDINVEYKKESDLISVNKSGNYNQDTHEITWTININPEQGRSLAGYYITDTQFPDWDRITFEPSYAKNSANYNSASHKITFDGTYSGNVTLTYKTKVDIPDTATTIVSNDFDDSAKTQTSTVTVKIDVRDSLEKSLKQTNTETVASSGDIIKILNWEANIIHDGLFSGLTYTDTLSVTGDNASHTITDEQLNAIKITAKSSQYGGSTTLTKDTDYTINLAADKKSFTITFKDTLDTAGYNYVNISYQTTATANANNNFGDDNKIDYTFNNSASFNGNSDNDNGYTLTRTNPNVNETMNLGVNKEWSGDESNTSRPENITVKVMYKTNSDGTWRYVRVTEGNFVMYGQEGYDSASDYTLNLSTGNWNKTINGLPKKTAQAKEDGTQGTVTEYYYKVVETAVGGNTINNGMFESGNGIYTISYNNENGVNGDNTLDITNTYYPDITLTPQKVWAGDSGAANGISDVTFVLMYSVDDRNYYPVKENGSDYSFTKDTDITNACTVTVSGSGNTWTGTNFENLPTKIFIDGQIKDCQYKLKEIKYNDKEITNSDRFETSDGYYTISAGNPVNASGNITVTNTFTKNIDVTPNKTWVDKNGQPHTPSDVAEITVRLEYSNSNDNNYYPVKIKDNQYIFDNGGNTEGAVFAEKVLTLGSNWTADAWSNLPKKYIGSDGNEKTRTYRIVEVSYKLAGSNDSHTLINNKFSTPNGYYECPTSSGNTDSNTTGNATLSLQNKFYPNKSLTIKASKIWQNVVDTSSSNTNMPASITVELQRKASNTGVWETVTGFQKTLNAKNSWKCDWTGLPNQDTLEGTVVTYSYRVAETEFTKYDGTKCILTSGTNIFALSSDGYYQISYGNNELYDDGTATITNTWNPNEMEITPQKKWIDTGFENQRPTNITLKLQRKLGVSGTYEDVKGTVDENGNFTADENDIVTITLSDNDKLLYDTATWQGVTIKGLPKEKITTAPTFTKQPYYYRLIETAYDSTPIGNATSFNTENGKYTISYSNSSEITSSGIYAVTNTFDESVGIRKSALDSNANEINSIQIEDLPKYKKTIDNKDYYVFNWKLAYDIPKNSYGQYDQNQLNKVTPVMDKLPDGFTLVEDSSLNVVETGICDYANGNGTNANTPLSKATSNQYTTNPTGKYYLSPCIIWDDIWASYVKSEGNKADAWKNPGQSPSRYYYDKTNNIVYFGKPAISSVPYFTYSIKIECQKLEDKLEKGSYIITNNAERYDVDSSGSGTPTGKTATASLKIVSPTDTDLITKTYSPTAIPGYISYSLNVNPEGKNLSNGNTIDIEDIFKTNKYFDKCKNKEYTGSDLVDVLMNSIRLYKVDTDGNKIPLASNEYTLQFQNGENVSDGAGLLKLTIPDEKHIVIDYTYKIIANEKTPSVLNQCKSSVRENGRYVNMKPGFIPPVGDKITFSNEASLKADSASSSSSQNNKEYEISKSSGTISTNRLPAIKKVNTGDYTINDLKATFLFAKYENGQWFYATSVDPTERVITWSETGYSGNSVDPNALEINVTDAYQVALSQNVLYKLVEVSVPNGYEGSNLGLSFSGSDNQFKEMLIAYLNNGTTVYSGKDYKTFLENYVSTHYFSYNSILNSYPEGITAQNVMQIKSGDNIEIPNNELIDIGIKKSWITSDSMANTEITVELYWSYEKSASGMPAGAKLATAKDLGIMDDSFTASKTVSASADNSQLWKDLPNGKNNKPVYYYVKETAYKINGITYTLAGDGTYKANDNTVGSYYPTYIGNASNSDSVIEIRNSAKLMLKKEWKKSNNEIMKNPPVERLTVSIYGLDKSGTKTAAPIFSDIELSKDNNWEYDITSLITSEMNIGQYKGFIAVESGISEDISSNFVVSCVFNINSSTGEIIVTNKSTAPTEASVKVNKVWGDGSEMHANDSIQITLYQKSGTPIDLNGSSWQTVVKSCTKIGTAVLNSENKWNYTWTGLPLENDKQELYYYYVLESMSYDLTNANGEPITVEGVKDKDKYNPAYAVTDKSISKTEYTITNSRNAIVAKKQWIGEDGEILSTTSGDIPVENITLEVYKKAVQVPESGLKIVAFGDSITDGYGSSEPNCSKNGKDYPSKLVALLKANNYTITNGSDVYSFNKGISGQQIGGSDNEGFRGRVNNDIPSDTNIVFFLGGTNDIHQSGSSVKGDPQGVYERFVACITKIKKQAPNAVIFVGSIPHFDFYKDGNLTQGGGWWNWLSGYSDNDGAIPNGYIDRYNTLIKNYAETTDGVYFVDVCSVVTDDYIRADGCHPNEEGYTAIANAYYNAVNNYYNSSEKVGEITLNAGNNWISALDIDNAEANAKYYVVEKSVPAGWQVSYADNEQKLGSGKPITVTNTRHTPKTSISVRKTWENDSANILGRDAISLTLLRSTDRTNWEELDIEMPTPYKPDNVWTYTYGVDENNNLTLPAEDNAGNQYFYKVEEAPLDGYTTSYGNPDGIIAVDDGHAGTLEVTNTRAISLSVKKIWSDSDKNDHLTDKVKVSIFRSTDKSNVPSDSDLILQVVSAVSVGAGKDITISANKKITSAESDKTGIATVTFVDKNITVHGVAEGTATITVSDGKETRQISVTVSALEMFLNDNQTFKIEAGTTGTLSVKKNGSDVTNAVFTSDNPNISVSGSEITAHALGKATITAECDGLSVTQEIEVVLPETFSITGESEVTIGSDITLGIDKNYGTFTWESSNTGIATVVNGKVTGVSAGTVTIKATRNDGKTETKEITVLNSAVSFSKEGAIEFDSSKNISNIKFKVNKSNGWQYVILKFDDNNYIKCGWYNMSINTFIVEDGVDNVNNNTNNNNNSKLTNIEYDVTNRDEGELIITFKNNYQPSSIIIDKIENNATGSITINYASAKSSSYSFRNPNNVNNVTFAGAVQRSGDIVADFEITSSDTDWTKTVDNLDVYAPNGQPYYYWAVEETVSGYDVSYLFEDSDAKTDYCINASEPGAGKITIKNTKQESQGVEMPSTGGTGTQPYKVIGFAVAGGALIMLGIRRRKKHC